jgi:predicted adenine nucleotide alpha hydrolase (AANH) superfamily ATPase
MPGNRLLVHCCCAHCAAYTASYFRDKGYEVGALWYNPNIHPFTEHEARRKAVTELSGKLVFPLITAEGYDMPEYFQRVAGHEDERCRYCFEMRLLKTAEIAVKEGFNAFTSTLLISPHQKHELIREIGDKVAQGKGIPFLYADLRKRYSDSRHITKPLDLYRQQYCGCIYSEWERYRKTENNQPLL